MSETSGTITLYQVIKDFQHISGRGERDYYRLLNMATMCLRDLNMFTVDRVKTYKVNTAQIGNDLGIIPYPDDCLGVYGVFMNDGGTLYPLVERDDMIYTLSENISGSISTSYQNEDIGEGVTLDSGQDNGFATRGAKSPFYFHDDTNKRRLIINGTGDVQLWIQYVSSGIDKDKGEQTVVPAYYEEAIHNYLLWKESYIHMGGDIRKKEAYFREYKKSIKKIRSFEAPTLQEYKDALYSVWRRTPKR
jgi:hypothetical protein